MPSREFIQKTELEEISMEEICIRSRLSEKNPPMTAPPLNKLN